MKKSYKKPEMKKVRLVPSEAVLAACKTVGVVGGPAFTNCELGNATCSNLGS